MQLRWIALSAAGATVAALAASAVSAGSLHASTELYNVSLTGSQRSVVTRTGTGTNDLGCTVRHADRDVQTIAFASRKRVALRLTVSGLPLIRFDLGARVTGSFHRETRSVDTGADCVSAPTKSDRSCGPARAPARLALRPEGSLRVRLDGGFARATDRARCATTLVTPDDFIVTSENRLKRSPAGAARVVLHGHLVQRTTVARVTQTTTVDWSLVLTRV